MNTPPDIPVAESQRLIAKHHVPQGRRYAKAVALMALAVLAGIIIGVGGTVLYFNKKTTPGAASARRHSPGDRQQIAGTRRPDP